jgi:hypothetical protein
MGERQEKDRLVEDCTYREGGDCWGQPDASFKVFRAGDDSALFGVGGAPFRLRRFE